MNGKACISIFILFVLTFFTPACGIGAPTARPIQPATDAPTPSEAAQPPDQTQPPEPEQTSDSMNYLIQALDNTLLVVDANGQTTPYASSEHPFNSPLFQNYPSNRIVDQHLYAIGPGIEGRNQVFFITPGSIQPLEFVGEVGQGLAVWPGNETQLPRLGWDVLILDPQNNSVTSRLFVGNADGSEARMLQEEVGTERVLVAGRWSRDGQRLYFSKEPLGLGGYILFGGASNLWAYNLTEGRADLFMNDPGVICIDDLSYDETLIAHHCTNPRISIVQISTGKTSTINPPAGIEANFVGSARISLDGQRVAFGIARGNPDSEQGWVAVSDGLSGEARLIATAPAGDYFLVAGWLDNDTLVLQSWGATPGVWLVNIDGSNLRRLADGVYQGLISGG